MARGLKPYVGRLAPSPTGALHLGNARTFMIAWLRARSQGGKVVMRMEDLDHPRDKPGAAAAAAEDLKWLGFDWDEEFVQSQRRQLYRAALEKLREKNLVYPCVCSRRDVEAAQSAPHEGEQLHYSGRCRGRFADWAAAQQWLDSRGGRGRTPCWRFQTPPEAEVQLDDVFAGRRTWHPARELGDFPLARDPDGAGYTLAVTVDDAAMGVTEVVRGDDLLPATPAQLLIYAALGLEPPAFCHVPLVVGPDGRRLAKRHGDTRIAAFREAGMRPEELVGMLAAGCGLARPGAKVALRELVGDFDLAKIPKTKLVWQRIGVPL